MDFKMAIKLISLLFVSFTLLTCASNKPTSSMPSSTTTRITPAPAPVAPTPSPTPTTPTPSAPPPAQTPTPTPSTTTNTSTRIEGLVVPGSNLTAKLTWLERSADSNNAYILDVNANENIDPHIFDFQGGTNITVILRGIGENRTIRLRSTGSMFTVNANVTFILLNNITLQGHNNNYNPLVLVAGGVFKMYTGSYITGNINDRDLQGNLPGGGVHINSGTFEMNGGVISGNVTNRGGGVFVGVQGTFNMLGGSITNNTANFYGGGVYSDGMFVKSGGTITGYNTDRNNGNVVKDADQYILARRGHAVYVNDSIRKETTAGVNDNMTYGGNRRTAGAWDN